MALKNKYQREKQQYSTDGGITWFDVTPPNYRKGRVIETASEDCNYGLEYLTTEALSSGYISFGTVTYYDSSSSSAKEPLDKATIAYSKNNGEWVYQNTSYASISVSVVAGDIVRWKGLYNDLTANVITTYEKNGGSYQYKSFSNTTANINVYGNVKSLLYGDNFTTFDETGKTVCIRGVFGSSSSSSRTFLHSAENLILPANMAEDAYRQLFYNQTNLTTAPELPAITLVEYCYQNMFYNCTSLVTAPELPATTLANYCYDNMFYGCTSLVTAPALPATTLANYCYRYMFARCTSLVTAPELPATTLTSSCYTGMFYNCTSLVTAPELPATTLTVSCYSGMFQGCTSLNYIKAMFTTTPGTTYTNLWVQNVAATGTFVKNSAATWEVTGNNGIPSGWTVQTASE